MNISDIQIPYKQDRGLIYRIFEILPGLLSWVVIFLPLILALISPVIAAYAITIYLVAWFLRSMAMTVRTLQSYKIMRQHQVMDWQQLIDDLRDPQAALRRIDGLEGRYPLKWHKTNLRTYHSFHQNDSLNQDNLYHAFVIPFHREGREILQPSLDALAEASYDMKKVIVVLTAEERAGPESGELAHKLAEEYRSKFGHFVATVHPGDLPDEIKGKGPNANWGMRILAKYCEENSIPAENVVVTSIDCDHRVHHNYLNSLTYFYLVCPDRANTSFQPITLFTNNIWDVPAPMRVIATGNSFWTMIVSLRPHMLRNFASHSQSLEALIATEYYSTRTVVEDGHQYWRTYFRYDGKHDVFPLFTPIYHDAVMAGSYRKTIFEQFKQLRRWAYGASDVAYVATTGFFKKNKVPKWDLFFKLVRLIEGHVSWATTPLLLLFAAMVPVYANPQAKETIIANQLPIIASYIQTLALVGIFATMFLSIKLLPPKPKRYRRWRYIPIALQWVLMPVTSIIFASIAAFNSQTRLMLGKYLDVFDSTIKVVKK
ncbi:glycosyltransferase family 2 protein [Candidatus Saccharibacteria bacterium]|nr:glycosyltransferase family 2 protein [Candidatus Saccharibacteria bacterium]